MWSRSGGSLCSASSGQIKLISPHCHDFSLMSACWKFAPTGNRPELYTAARRAQLCTAGHRNEDVHEQRRRRHSRVRQTVRHDCDEQGQGVAGEAWVDLTPATHGEWCFNGNRSSVNALYCECCTCLDPCSQEILTHEVFTHHFLFGSTSGQRAAVFRLSCGGTAALRAPQSLQDFPLFLLSCV